MEVVKRVNMIIVCQIVSIQGLESTRIDLESTRIDENMAMG